MTNSMNNDLKQPNNCSDNSTFSLATDIPSEEDLLGLTPYTEAVAKYIEESKVNPLSISIQGRWGVGKTSFVGFVEKKLCKNNYLWIKINTWQLSVIDDNPDTFPILIMKQIIKELGGSKELEKLLKVVGSIASDNINLISTILPIIGKPAKILKQLNINFDGILETLTDNDLYSQTNKIKQKFEDLVKSKLENGNNNYKKIIIFIDDLDRLKPSLASDLLEKITNFLKVKGCVFIFAVDADVIKNGVVSKFEGLQDSDIKKEQFFEKIIQMPYSLPVTAYDISKYIKFIVDSQRQTNKVNSEEYLDLEEAKVYEEIIINILGDKNPRNIKRTLNLFDLYRYIVSCKEKAINMEDKYNLRMIFGLTCIQMNDELKFNQLYEYDDDELIEHLDPVFVEKIGINSENTDYKKLNILKGIISSLMLNSDVINSSINVLQSRIRKYFDDKNNDSNYPFVIKPVIEQGKIFLMRKGEEDTYNQYITIAGNKDNTTKITLYTKDLEVFDENGDNKHQLEVLKNSISSLEDRYNNIKVRLNKNFTITNIDKEVEIEEIIEILDNYINLLMKSFE